MYNVRIRIRSWLTFFLANCVHALDWKTAYPASEVNYAKANNFYQGIYTTLLLMRLIGNVHNKALKYFVPRKLTFIKGQIHMVLFFRQVLITLAINSLTTNTKKCRLKPEPDIFRHMFVTPWSPLTINSLMLVIQ